MPPDGHPEAPPAEMACPTCHAPYPGSVAFCPKDGARLQPSTGGMLPQTPSLVGQVLADRYRILRKLGEGGMGEVFEAQHVYIDKHYAIKTLRREITTNPDAVMRFHQEARSASTIGHENIVEIDDFGRLPDGGVYLAMEFLEGASLAERMRSGPPLEFVEKLDVMIQVCRGLAAAHEKGIVHRDMKPENIFLCRKTGRAGSDASSFVVKVLDFGIAKVTADNAHHRLTQTGTIFGTPYYMSPEQALGKPLDGRTDIYSVGVILYEVFTGRVPFEGESFMGILSQHITAPPRRPSELTPVGVVPGEIERVILRALAKDPAERWPSMHFLIDELERIAAAAREEVPATRAPGGMTSATRARESLLPRTTTPAFGSGRTAPVVRSQPLLVPLEPSAPPVPIAAELPAEDHAPVELEEPRRWSQAHAAGQAAGSGAPRPAHHQGRLIAILAGGMLIVGAAALVAVLMDRPAGRARGPERGAAPPSFAVATPTGVSPPTVEVVIDSVPTGAKVFAGGQLIAETPDAVKLPVGHTLEVLIRKDGYVPRQAVLDPVHEPKMVVRLEREHRGATPPAGHHALPHLLPGVIPPDDTAAPPQQPAQPQPPPRRVAPSRTSNDDLYAPVPAPPPRRRPPPGREPPKSY
jgi:serine/threonine-protein kinase